MNYRKLGKTGYRISEISFGAWAIGGSWGPVDDQQSLAALHAAIDHGVNFIDTADVYGDGRSERLIAELRSARSESILVATKAGRRLDPHVADGYSRENLTAFVHRSLKNLNTDSLDLLQLHCPPTDVFYRPEIFEVLDELQGAGDIRHYGVSVERVEEALKAIEFPGVATVQIIFNVFRQRPAEHLLSQALDRQVGILARLPLASGLLTGKFTTDSAFASDDHRSFNRQGEAFDRGETFSGIDFDEGLAATQALREQLPEGVSMTQFALRWILMHEAVSCAIPGARKPHQVVTNCSASSVPALSADRMSAVSTLYDERIRSAVHQRW